MKTKKDIQKGDLVVIKKELKHSKLYTSKTKILGSIQKVRATSDSRIMIETNEIILDKRDVTIYDPEKTKNNVNKVVTFNVESLVES